VAALSQDRKTLTVAVVNPSLKALNLELAVKGTTLAGQATRWQIAGSNPMAFNDPGKPATVAIETATIENLGGKLAVAPCSVTLFSLPTK
jgi:alpha-N-arabinofuranosidase